MNARSWKPRVSKNPFPRTLSGTFSKKKFLNKNAGDRTRTCEGTKPLAPKANAIAAMRLPQEKEIIGLSAELTDVFVFLVFVLCFVLA